MAKRQYRKYDREQVEKLVKEVNSMCSLIKALGLKAAGGNFANMKRLLQKWNITADHWKGQSWNKNQQLKDWSKYSRTAAVKKHLIKKRGAICNKCKLTDWKDLPIPLEVHHIDGDRTNNNYDNLEILCCNCHAQTDNWKKSKVLPERLELSNLAVSELKSDVFTISPREQIKN